MMRGCENRVGWTTHGALVIFTGSSPLAPLIHTIF